jgi:uncharacterized cupin superfamily protein
LWNLTRALNIDFAGLLERQDEPDKITVLRSPEIPKIENRGKDCVIKILSAPDEVGSHEVYDISFGSDGNLKSAPHATGTREQVTVLDGAVRVHSGSAEEILRAGDSAQYAGDVPHIISAEGDGARFFLIVKGG